MIWGTQGRVAGIGKSHPDLAVLHAFAAGEVDPAQRAAIRSHIEACVPCQNNLVRVESMRRALEDVGPRDLDDLSWKRISQRVQVVLEAEAADRLAREVAAAPRPLGWGWAAAGGVAAVAAAVGILLVVAPRPRSEVRLAKQAPAPVQHAPQPLTIVSGDAPFDFTLSGAHLHLGKQGHLEVTKPDGPAMEVRLDEGELEIDLATAVDASAGALDESIEVTTPEMRAIARSAAFTILYKATEMRIGVRRGQVTVEGDAFLSSPVVREGELRVIQRAPSAPEAKVEPPREAEPRPLAEAARPRRPVAEPRPKAEPVAPPAAPIAPGPVEAPLPLPSPLAPEPLAAEAAPAPVAPAPVAPPVDPVAADWQAASEAYYTQHDPLRAIDLAEGIAKRGGDRAEVQLALGLLCDAYADAKRGNDALKACERFLGATPREEFRRGIHYKIANVLRTQLHDCRAASEHYGAAIVFGGSSALDDDARLGRAECALAAGDLEAAERDVRALEGSQHLVRRPEFVELRSRLAAARAAAAGSGRGQ
jgi:hypothetical protein